MFTVVIPSYKSYDTLHSAVKSCTHKYITEIIVVDDNDKVTRESPSYFQEFSNLIVLYNNKNMGVTYSRNKGYFKAKNKYVIFLDSDDELILENLTEAASLIKNSSCELFFFNTVTCGVKNSKQECAIKGDFRFLFKMANSGERLLVLKKNKFKPFIGLLKGHELCGLLFWSIKCGAKLTWLPLTLRHYSNNNNDSLSNLRLSYNRARLISLGHRLIAKKLLSKFIFFNSIKYFIKAVYYDYKKGSTR